MMAAASRFPWWLPGLLAAGATALLVASLASRWIASGPGSTYAGFRLARILRDGTIRPDGSGTVFWGLLTVGVGAAAVAGSAPFTRRGARLVRAVIGATLGGLLVIGAGSGTFPIGSWATGPWLALAGSVLAVASALGAGESDRIVTS